MLLTPWRITDRFYQVQRIEVREYCVATTAVPREWHSNEWPWDGHFTGRTERSEPLAMKGQRRVYRARCTWLIPRITTTAVRGTVRNCERSTQLCTGNGMREGGDEQTIEERQEKWRERRRERERERKQERKGEWLGSCTSLCGRWPLWLLSSSIV